MNFLYFDLYLNTAYTAHYVYFTIWSSFGGGGGGGEGVYIYRSMGGEVEVGVKLIIDMVDGGTGVVEVYS